MAATVEPMEEEIIAAGPLPLSQLEVTVFVAMLTGREAVVFPLETSGDFLKQDTILLKVLLIRISH